MITDIEGLIMADQRELRSYVEQLRPRRRIEVPFDFQSRMDDLRSRFEKQWGIGVAFEIESIEIAQFLMVRIRRRCRRSRIGTMSSGLRDGSMLKIIGKRPASSAIVGPCPA